MEFYRGKDEHGNWVYGGINEHKSCIVSKFSFIPVDSATVTKNTLLQDQRGNWVFEGDLIQHCKIPVSYLEVFFDNEHGCFAVRKPIQSLSGKQLCNYTVVGNIFDNPELLKK